MDKLGAMRGRPALHPDQPFAILVEFGLVHDGANGQRGHHGVERRLADGYAYHRLARCRLPALIGTTLAAGLAASEDRAPLGSFEITVPRQRRH